MKIFRLALLALVLGVAGACDSGNLTFPECDPTVKGSGTC
jgi:hypothetical protein